MKNVKVFDFFSGCGGSSCGFKQAGMDIVFGLDIDKDAAQTYKNNFPEARFLNDDIRNVKAKDIKAVVDEFSNDLILFCGCAPCQPFSKQNRQKFDGDPRIDLLAEFSRLIKKSEPDFIFVENVPGLQKFKVSESPFGRFLSELKRLNYHVDYQVMPAGAYGVPQTRERLVLLASRHPRVSLPPATHGVAGGIPYSTVREWISSLSALEAGGCDSMDSDHVASRLSPLNLKRIQSTPEGGGRDSWPKGLILDCHKGHSGHTDVYGRLAWDKPASGLTTRCVSYSNGRFGHPVQHRGLSVREAACLQTFPKEYKFHGSINARARQIGNAVPPLMAEIIGKAILASLQ